MGPGDEIVKALSRREEHRDGYAQCCRKAVRQENGRMRSPELNVHDGCPGDASPGCQFRLRHVAMQPPLSQGVSVTASRGGRKNHGDAIVGAFGRRD